MRRWILGLVILLGSLPVLAQSPTINPVTGYCDLGGSKAQVSGLGSTNYQQGDIPGCTISVYLHGTLTLAPLYADDAFTPLANPFTAVVSTSPNSGFYIFWAAVNQGYDIVASGGTVPNTYPAPQTIKEIFLGGSGGGGGTTPCGVLYDIQINDPLGTFGCDSGIGQINPTTHTVTENNVNANQEVTVGNGSTNGLICQAHSTGSAVDAAYCTVPSATFSPTPTGGYVMFPPDNAPTAIGNVVTVSSVTPTNVVTPYGTLPGYPTHFVTAVSGLVSLENLPFLFTDIPCNSPATCGDLAPIQVPYQANNFYAGPRGGSGTVGFLMNTVTAQDNTGTATHAVFTFPYPIRTGDPLVLIVNANGSGLVTPTDTCGNTWVATSSGNAWYVVSAVACTGLDTVSQAIGGTGGYIIGGGEISGGGVLDTQASGGSCGSASGNTYPITFTSVTTTHIDTLVTLLTQGNTAQTGLGVYAATNGLFLENQANYDGGGGLGDSWSVAMAWKPALTPGSNNTTMNYTYTGGSNICSAADSITLAFKPSIINNPANPTARDIYMDDLEQHILSIPSDGHGLVFDAIYGIYYNLAFGSGLSYSASTHTLSASGAGLPSGTGVVRVDSSVGSASELSGAVVTSGSNVTVLVTSYRKRSCEVVWGGSGAVFALTAGDDAAADQSCLNDIGVTETITSVKCRSDAGSNTTTITPTFGATGTGTSICSGALTCGSSGAYSSTCTVSNGSLTSGTNINPVMGGTLTGTSIHMVVTYTLP